jgi:hypothetical protein
VKLTDFEDDLKLRIKCIPELKGSNKIVDNIDEIVEIITKDYINKGKSNKIIYGYNLFEVILIKNKEGITLAIGSDQKVNIFDRYSLQFNQLLNTVGMVIDGLAKEV